MLDSLILKLLGGGGVTAICAAVVYLYGKHLDRAESPEQARAKYIEGLQQNIDWLASQVKGLNEEVGRLRRAIAWWSKHNHKLRMIIFRCSQKFPVTSDWLTEQLDSLESDDGLAPPELSREE